MSGGSAGGALDDLTHEQILEYLLALEQKRDSLDNNDIKLLSKQLDAKESSEPFQYRERYLEYIVSLG